MTTWHEYIHKMEANASFDIWGPCSRSVQSVVEDYQSLMQEQFPGDYMLTYTWERGQLDLHPYFQDPDEELMWNLKWG